MTDIQKMFKTWCEAWSTNDPEKMVGLFSEAFLYEDVTSGHQFKTILEVKAFFGKTFNFSPDFKMVLKGGFLNGDFACFEWTMMGRTSGDPGQPTTGKAFSVRGTTVWEMEAGRVKRNSDYWDMCTLLVQIGQMPSPFSDF